MDNLQQIPLTFNHVNAGAAAGTTNTFTTTANTAASIKGKFASALASGSNAAITPTTDANTGLAFPALVANQAAAVVFGVNAAGSLVAVQGPVTATAAGATTTPGAFIAAPQFPAIPDTMAPIAYTIVRCPPTLPNGNGFILGTTNWTVTSALATTFQNISSLPNRPQIA